MSSLSGGLVVTVNSNYASHSDSGAVPASGSEGGSSRDSPREVQQYGRLLGRSEMDTPSGPPFVGRKKDLLFKGGLLSENRTVGPRKGVFYLLDPLHRVETVKDGMCSVPRRDLES